MGGAHDSDGAGTGMACPHALADAQKRRIMKQKLLVPVDYSAGSLQALEYAAMLADHLKIEVHVIHVWECMPHPPPELHVQTAEQGERLLLDLIQENAEHEMRTFLAKVNLPKGVRCSHAVLSGEASRRILDVLQTEDYAWVVMGTHGRSGFRHFVLGSVAERVVRHSRVGVITVPPRVHAPAGKVTGSP